MRLTEEQLSRILSVPDLDFMGCCPGAAALGYKDFQDVKPGSADDAVMQAVVEATSRHIWHHSFATPDRVLALLERAGLA